MAKRAPEKTAARLRRSTGHGRHHGVPDGGGRGHVEQCDDCGATGIAYTHRVAITNSRLLLLAEPPRAMGAAGGSCRQVPADAAASQLGVASATTLPLLPG